MYTKSKELNKRNSESGVTMVEVAISAFVFIVMLIFITDLAQTGYRFLTLQFVVNRSIRFVNLGPDPQVPGSNCTAQRIADINNFVTSQAQLFNLPTLDDDDVMYCVVGDSCNFGDPDNPGVSRDFVQIRIRVPISITAFQMVGVQPNYTISAGALGRNEPFGLLNPPGC